MSGKQGMANDQTSQKAGSSQGDRAARFEVSGAELPIEAREIIGRQLRKAYDARLSEPIPDKFTKLLDALSKREGS